MQALIKNKTVLALAIVGGGFWLLSGGFFKSNKTNKIPEKISYNYHVRPILSDRCFKCHGPDEKKREAGLRFDIPEGAYAALGKNKDRYAIVPNHPEKSTLVTRIFSADKDTMMPPPDSHLSLNETEKQILKRWIEQGAKYETHWAFVAPQKPALPKVSNQKWAKNPIDLFVLQKQQENDLTPSVEADKVRLLRRLSFDITGLPPSNEVRDRYLNDKSPDAYEKLVDTLLASSAYGERMAMNWLDLARYSDSHGYQDDLPRVMWPWRDWVIHAFNKNMPYDQFVTWQLAGDLLPAASREMLLASGFNRNHKITQEGGVIDEEYRVEYVADRTNTFGKAFLGLTLECARCHDHKYDPILTKEYYSISAYFNKVPEVGFVPNLETPKPYMTITQEDLKGALSFLNASEDIKTEKDTIKQMIMLDSIGKNPRKTYILKRGQYDLHGDEVTEGVVEQVLPLDTTLPKNRLGLSQWLFDKKNPLTARVMVNRLWQEIFGRGIVATSDNFGIQGALPSHPELLDWLAIEFQESKWDIKHMLRLMVTSATYRQSSKMSKETLERDPENVWLSHAPRFRMPYEFIRDNILVATDLLEPIIGGVSVKPWQPEGIWEEIACEESATNFRGEFSYTPDTAAGKLYRRSLYTYNRRTIPPPVHLIYDAPIRDNCEVRRTRTSTPLQSLAMLNDKQILEASRVLSAKLLKNDKLNSIEQKITDAFKRILTREPSSKELKLLTTFFNDELKLYSGRVVDAKKLLDKGLYPQDPSVDAAKSAALMLVISTIFNMDEAINKT